MAICYLENERLTKTLIRSSLGSLYDSLEFRSIVRCHRSYLVNLIQVSAIKGGKNDMVLFLNQGDLSIPVSKSYREEIRHSLAVQGA